MLLRPRVPVPLLGWASLLTGVAVATAVRRMTAWSQTGEGFLGDGGDVAVDARLKWPNDVIVEDRKLAGILVEKVEDGLVVGVGLNVGLRKDELPVPTATSLAIEGAPLSDRAPLLRAILREYATWYREWTALGGDPETSGLRTAYKDLCATLGGGSGWSCPAGSGWPGRRGTWTGRAASWSPGRPGTARSAPETWCTSGERGAGIDDPGGDPVSDLRRYGRVPIHDAAATAHGGGGLRGG
ncbi:biotin--[acetyl-CoA-carboxylase] ligase [Actinomadura madurae]|uniref:biotin--[acetyl-CoA-carboxylase] ligase n=1 Tax=Actinomadura madurae TaxID=1993 RepID=UPI003FD74B3C